MAEQQPLLLEWPHPGPEARAAKQQPYEQAHQMLLQQQQQQQPQTQQQAQAQQEKPATPPPQHPTQQPIDPTKNVLDLVEAAAKANAELRQADAKYSEAMLQKEHELQTAMRQAEIRRQDDLARMKADFDSAQADMLRIQVANNAKLVSEQLDKVTGVLGDRIAKLEQFRYESSGRGVMGNSVIGWAFGLITLAIAVWGLLLKTGIGGVTP